MPQHLVALRGREIFIDWYAMRFHNVYCCCRIGWALRHPLRSAISVFAGDHVLKEGKSCFSLAADPSAAGTGLIT